MLRIGISAVILVGELTLILFAWKTWITSVRTQLPRWRNALSCAALLLLSLNWCGAAALAVLLFTHQDAVKATALGEIMLTLSRPIVVIATALAVALKRMPRVGGILAGLLMFVGWPLGSA
jgi:hypothetical protein